MITYIYWSAVIAVAGGALLLLGVKAKNWSTGISVSAVLLLIAFVLFHFYFQNVFVKRYGGQMTISVPAGMQHVSVTWKDDNLRIENYDPATNRCIFQEYSRGDLLEGKAILKHCNPLRGPVP